MYSDKFLMRCLATLLLTGFIAACGGGSSEPAAPSVPVVSVAPSQAAGSNVLPVFVDSGPAGTGYNVNRLYTTVTVCEPGSSTRCQTIDHVLVDTGSTGLRLLASELAGDLRLSPVNSGNRFALLNCVEFADATYAWGSVKAADILLGDKRANNVPIQVIAEAGAGTPAIACATGKSAITTATELGARGIIGMDLFKEDCGVGCTGNPENEIYYACTNASCVSSSGSVATLEQQVKNPVPLFVSDNNGLVIDFSNSGRSASPSLKGSLIFGINTVGRSNNRLERASLLPTDADGFVTTTLPGFGTYSRSFFDTGSNGIFFDSTIKSCDPAVRGSYFYCPDSPLTFTATIQGRSSTSVQEMFSIDKASTLFDGVNTVLPTLSGNILHAGMFDWGLPFFYGRRVFFGIEGQFIQDQPRVPFYAF